MLKEPVSFVIGVGIAKGDGLGGAAIAASTPVPTAVNAAAPDPAAFKKFLREYFMVSPLGEHPE
jgi:F0F1-type ATP synthase membrane subunit c/vacuolar-type H+-ATPase subunit K